MKYYRNFSKKILTFKTLIFVEKLNYFAIKNQPIDQKYYLFGGKIGPLDQKIIFVFFRIKGTVDQ
jgi:hypothetical protein